MIRELLGNIYRIDTAYKEATWAYSESNWVESFDGEGWILQRGDGIYIRVLI